MKKYLLRYELFLLILKIQYRLYGEQVVKAAIRNSVHYVDICGEPYVCYFSFFFKAIMTVLIDTRDFL